VNPRETDPLTVWPADSSKEHRELDPRLIAFLDGVIVGICGVLVLSYVLRFVPPWLP